MNWRHANSPTHTVTPADAGQENTAACLPAGGPVRRKQPNNTNNKKREKRLSAVSRWGGCRRKFGLDKHRISHSEESPRSPRARRKHNQKNIEAVILQTSVSFLPREGQHAV